MNLFAAVVLAVLPSLAVAQQWVGTWTTAQQQVEQNNLPPSPGLSGNSLRQIVQVSIGGQQMRLKLSNEFSKGNTQILGVEIAKAKTSGSASDIDESTTRAVTFAGKTSVTIAAGAMVTSDPVAFTLEARDNVAITIHYGSCSNTDVTGHPGSRTASYLAQGNTSDFAGAKVTEHWYTICGIDVTADERDNACAVAILGNSITDGRGSTTNHQDRWADNLSRRLLANDATRNVGVLNLGIGGNCVIGGGLGPSASARYMRDLFGQEGVRYIILFEGINDLGYCGNGVQTAQQIIGVFRQIINEAHKRGIWVYGAPITPFKGNSYYSVDHEKGRQTFNDWVRNGDELDGVIDFDALIRDPQNPEQMQAKYLYQNDYLHPNAQGYIDMADAIDLSLFSQVGEPEYTDPRAGKEFIYFEAEDMIDPTVGTAFGIVNDAKASGGKYLKTTVNNANLPTDKKCFLNASFTTTQEGPYRLYFRVNCPTYDDDSYYIKIDNSDYARVNGIVTSGWQWLDMGAVAESPLPLATLAPGHHTISIASREDGACLDRICICNYPEAPTGFGEPAPDLPVRLVSQVAERQSAPAVYSLQGQRMAEPLTGFSVIDGRKVFIE